MSTENLKIESFARGLGFHLVSVMPPFPLKDDKKYFDDWIKNGYEADLDYMRNTAEERAEPEMLLPGVKSIICLAMNYYQPFTNKPKWKYGKVARYAWGKDYHNVIGKKLKKIRNFIIEKSEGELTKKDFRLFCDAGPILERACALKAGFGFIGKNGMLITKEYGSWVFLAEILVRAKLKYSKISKPKGLSCGSCTKCMDACPANAIIKPHVIDAKKCISYQTIENKKKIPRNIGKNLNNWIFGCDICQEVCPHNSRSKKTNVPEFLNHRAGPYINLEELLKMKEGEFNKKYAGSPLKRAGLKKLKETLNYVNIDT